MCLGMTTLCSQYPLIEQWANKEELDLLHHIMLGVKNPFIFIYNVTNGNPFFVQQQIISLREKNLLRFEEKWVWDDIDIMEEAGMLDNDVVSVLSEKIKRLPSLTQQVLKVRSSTPYTA